MTKCKSGSFEFSQLILVLRLPFIYVEKQNHANKCDVPSSFRHLQGIATASQDAVNRAPVTVAEDPGVRTKAGFTAVMICIIYYGCC